MRALWQPHTLVGACAIVLVVLVFVNFPDNVLMWDVYGAYLYLPATFIYSDVYLQDMSWLEALNAQYGSTPHLYQFFEHSEGKQIIQYPSGFAVIYLPFFLVAHLIASLTSYPADGFSYPYQFAIVTGHLFYLVAGLIMAFKVLKYFFDEWLSAFLVLLLLCATNFLFTAVFMVAMPHVHLFLFYALIVYYTIRWHEHPSSRKNSILLGVVLGLACLIRASEVLAVFIPLLWGIGDLSSLKSKIRLLNRHKQQVLLVIGFFIFPGLLQLVYYKLGTGTFFYNAYQNNGEGFDLFSPYLSNFLWSFRKGWWLYTPVMFLTAVGMIVLWTRRAKPTFLLAFTVFALLNVYLLASWTCWWYAESFGQRSIVQSCLIYLVFLGALVNAIRHYSRKLLVVFVLLVAACSALNIVQSYQMRTGLLHPSRTTRESYLAHFLRFNAHPEFESMLLLDKHAGNALQDLDHPAKTFERKSHRFMTYDGADWRDTPNRQPGVIYLMQPEERYSRAIQIPVKDVLHHYDAVLEVKVEGVIEPNFLNEEAPLLVVNYKYQERLYGDQYKSFEEAEYDTLTNRFTLRFVTYIPDVRSELDVLEVFIWKRGQEEIGISYFDMSFHSHVLRP